ncbi:ribosome assembly RNA-binding protein YhbY [Candidatus Albibeggiatoa sp. nov. BB20]|uniref:ribosome assembly RNA-binding protein YhbY n=1 Tax=Candidatus Albibeggiatoa sp. nov. BB20 TaxID=3162723 RepID=UPI003365587A
MPLNSQQIRKLRALAHHLKPVIMVGDKGISENLLKELDRALETHELIKVSIAGADKASRLEMTQALCEASKAETVQIIGRISILYRKNKEPKIRV